MILTKETRVKEYVVFVVANTEGISGRIVAAFHVLRHRLNNNIWGLNERTRYKRYIDKGTKAVFYVAGQRSHSQCFVAEANVVGLPTTFLQNDLPRYAKVEEWLYDLPTYKIELENVEWFNSPVGIYDIRSQIDMFAGKNIKRWGAYLRGGVARITENDYRLIKALSTCET